MKIQKTTLADMLTYLCPAAEQFRKVIATM